MDTFKDPIPWAKDIFLVCVGIAPSTLVPLVIWLATTPQDLLAKNWWAGVLMGAIFLAAIGVGVVSFLESQQAKARVKRDAQLLGEDMDAVYEPHKQIKPNTET